MIEEKLLAELVAKGHTIREIGKICQCSNGSVRHWLKKYNMKTLNRQTPRTSNDGSGQQQHFQEEIDDETFSDIVKTSTSYAAVTRACGLSTRNGCHNRIVRQRIANLKLSTEHFKLNPESYRHRRILKYPDDDFEWYDNLDEQRGITGIYLFVNKQNSNRYVGQALDIRARCKRHYCNAYNSDTSEHNTPLHRAIRKYGAASFEIHLLQECQPEELNDLEKKYIHLFGSFERGYNQTPGGDSADWTLEEKLEISGHKADILGCIKDLQNTDLSYDELSAKWHMATGSISELNNGLRWKMPEYTYPLRPSQMYKRKNNLIEEPKCCDCGSAIDIKSQRCPKCNNIYRKKEHRQELEEKVGRKNLADKIRNSSFENIGKEYGVTGKAIVKWCQALELPSDRYIIRQIPDDEWDEVIEHYDKYADYYQQLKEQRDQMRDPAYVVQCFKEGKHIKWISKTCHMDPSTIKGILVEHGITTFSHYPADQQIYCVEDDILFADAVSAVNYLLNKGLPDTDNRRAVGTSIRRAAARDRMKYCRKTFYFATELPPELFPPDHHVHAMKPVLVDKAGTIQPIDPI